MQTRLLEMEGKMSQLMSALQTVQTKATDVETEVSERELVGEHSDYSGSEDDNAIHGDGRLSEEGDMSSPGGSSIGSMVEADRLEVEEIYNELVSSSEDDTAAYPADMEAGGIRKRRVEIDDLSEHESL